MGVVGIDDYQLVRDGVEVGAVATTFRDGAIKKEKSGYALLIALITRVRRPLALKFLNGL